MISAFWAVFLTRQECQFYMFFHLNNKEPGMNLLELSLSFRQHWSLLSTVSNTEDCPCGSCSLSLHLAPLYTRRFPCQPCPCAGGGRTALAELIRATALLHSKARAVKCALCCACSRAVPGSQQSEMEGVALKDCFSFARCQKIKISLQPPS